jgi:phosphate acetyltransferase
MNTFKPHSKFGALLARFKGLPPLPTAVVHPCDQVSLESAIDAAQMGLIEPLLVGPEGRIRALAQDLGLDLNGYAIENVPHSHAAAARAVALVREGRAKLLMKGSLHTDELMHEVTQTTTGLRTNRRLSHVFIMDVPEYHKTLYITDAAINIFPTLEDKVDICQNAIDLAHVMGIACPKVAILSAVETVTSKIPSTLQAAALVVMSHRRQITGAILDGPLAFDNAISKEAAITKGIDSEVAGDADILVVPDLEAGNILAKQLSFMAHADAAGIVVGARVPIILTSRADSAATRLASCCVGALLGHAREGNKG